jgi:hypothetical protein
MFLRGMDSGASRELAAARRAMRRFISCRVHGKASSARKLKVRSMRLVIALRSASGEQGLLDVDTGDGCKVAGDGCAVLGLAFSRRGGGAPSAASIARST